MSPIINHIKNMNQALVNILRRFYKKKRIHESCGTEEIFGNNSSGKLDKIENLNSEIVVDISEN